MTTKISALPNGQAINAASGTITLDSCTIGGNTAKAGSFSSITMTGAISCADNILGRPEIKDYSETVQTVVAAATTSIDIQDGNVVILTQDTNITTFNFNNPSPTGKACSFTLKRVKDNTGTTRSITWPASVDWSGATAPTLTQTANAVDIFTFFTHDAGTTWYGFLGGLNFG